MPNLEKPIIGMVWCASIGYNMIRDGMVQYSTVWQQDKQHPKPVLWCFGVVCYNTIQYDTKQQYGKVCYGSGRSSTPNLEKLLDEDLV